ncbi:terpene synthase family protein [Micromonospora sp. WMMA1363]|uniref:terpene synthase family protein n=1 Tax=Micromonospora sp. WMMA1363 TaxID=3053985 RepID=UPI00259C6A4B|nr:terpene synthase family protein [Micromonospora sp. WMMA1363]MDM4719186.1 terpene synthase family protein [Micromonospora sp. WMMA1363]
MTPTPHVPLAAGDALTAAEQGRACALAVSLERDLHEVVSHHQDLFVGRPFDPALVSGIAMSVAFTAPECTFEQLRPTARTVLWVFAADWHVDYLAQTERDVSALVAGCLAVADGSRRDDEHPLARLLADIRDELAVAPGFAAVYPMWREELGRVFAAMALELRWKTTHEAPPASRRSAPTLDEYLANADNVAGVLVSVTHWAHLADPDSLDHLDDLRAASRAVQRAIRLINDLATYRRDLQWGDLNALMLVSDSTEVTTRLAAVIEACHDLIRPLETTCPRQAAFLRRQVTFTSGFYQLSDFWGNL